MRGGLMQVSGLKMSTRPAFFTVGRPTLPPLPGDQEDQEEEGVTELGAIVL